jgi:hypothetical protein
VDEDFVLKMDIPNECLELTLTNMVTQTKKMLIQKLMGKILPFKELKDCLELHLHQSFYSIKLLTRGFFEVVFLEEEGTTRVRVMAVVEWEGLSMNFFKWHTLTLGRLKES